MYTLKPTLMKGILNMNDETINKMKEKMSKCDSCKHQNWYAGKRCCNYEGFIKKEPTEFWYNYKYSKEVEDFYKAYYKTIKQHPDTDFYKYSWFLANNKFLSHKQERSKNMKAKKQEE